MAPSCFNARRSRFLEIARVLVRLDHVAGPILVAARGAGAACNRFRFAHSTVATFDVFYRLQITNFDVSLLQAAPNRLDYIDVLILWLHRHLFVATLALGWAD